MYSSRNASRLLEMQNWQKRFQSFLKKLQTLQPHSVHLSTLTPNLYSSSISYFFLQSCHEGLGKMSFNRES